MTKQSQHTPMPFNVESMGYAVRDILLEKMWTDASANYSMQAINMHEELTHLLSAALSQIQYMRVDIKGLDGLPSMEHESCIALETQLKDAIAKAEGR